MDRCVCDANKIKQQTGLYESGLLTREELSIRIQTIKLETKHEKLLRKLTQRQNAHFLKMRDKYREQRNNLLKEQD